MVTRSRASTRGASAPGWLFSVMILLAVLYYGVDIGRTYWSYYKLLDEMQTTARFAQTQSDEVMLKHLVGVAQDLSIPAEGQRFTIRRTEHPPVVTIQTHYNVVLVFPFKRKTVTLRPEVEFRQ